MPPMLKSIFTYPIKGCGSLSHTQTTLDNYGLVGDRRWMVVDENGIFMTQRQEPTMALIQPSLSADCLEISVSTANGRSVQSIAVPLRRDAQETPTVRQVEVWGARVDSWDEGDTAAEFLSDFLHMPVRLVHMADSYQRAVDTTYATRSAQTAFTDGFPVLVVSEASLDELNQHLAERGSEPVPITRFRPNLVIAGTTPFAEDTWKTVQIGAVMLDIVKPCARCVVTTVDQQTGTIPDTAEPLATLNTFRKQGHKVMFAQNAIHHAPGQLAVNEMVTVIK